MKYCCIELNSDRWLLLSLDHRMAFIYICLKLNELQNTVRLPMPMIVSIKYRVKYIVTRPKEIQIKLNTNKMKTIIWITDDLLTVFQNSTIAYVI